MITGSDIGGPCKLRVATLIALILTVAVGCGDPPTTAPPSPDGSALVVPSFSQEELQSWAQFRRVYGLRTDVTWVIAVASDPAASDVLGLPLLPGELEHVAKANASTQTLLSPARGYGNQFRDEFAGAWIEGPLVVLAFTRGMATHQADVATLFGEKVLVRQAQYTLRELDSLAATVGADSQWFETIGADLISSDVNEFLNAVDVQYRAPSTAVEPLIRQRFGEPGWMHLTYAGPTPWTGARGALELTVVDRDGRAVAVECLLRTLDPRVSGEHLPQDAPGGKCGDTGLPAVEWLVDVTSTHNGEAVTTTEKLVVPPGGIARSTVVVDP